MEHRLYADVDFDQVMVDLSADDQVILVRDGDQVRAYRNRCPHQGIGLDWGDGRCLHDGDLVCAMHGARFHVADGSCFDGPCRGEKLESVPIKVENNAVYLA